MASSAYPGETPYLCSICGVAFNRASKLTRHVRFHVGDKRHVCPVCGAGHVTRGNLRAHLRIHTGEKPYACDICGQKFTMMAHKKRHLNTHHGAEEKYPSQNQQSQMASAHKSQEGQVEITPQQVTETPSSDNTPSHPGNS